MSRRSVAEFLSEFVLPFVHGGDLIVGNAISMADVQVFEEDLPHASEPLVAVDDARTEVLAELVVRPPALVLDADELRLAAAVYNVLFLVHPDADSWTIRHKSLEKVAETAQRLATQPHTRDRTRVLARHALLHNIFDLTRTDTTVSWWTGKATFLGQRPPKRLSRWSGVRRVRKETHVVGFQDLLTGEESLPTIAALLRRSPLTLLLGDPELSPPVRWEDAAFVLRDAELARALAYVALRPTDHKKLVGQPARYAAGLEQMLDRNPDEHDLRAVIAFLVHLNALLALAETRLRDPRAKSPLLTAVLAPERAGQRPRGLSTFFALPNALRRVDPRLAEPPGVRDDPMLARRWDKHRAQVADGIGEAVIDTLAGRLKKQLLRSPPRLESGSTDAPKPVEVSDNPR